MEIKNKYLGKTPKEVWTAWTQIQRTHFIEDHTGKQHTPATIRQYSITGYQFLPSTLKDEIEKHVYEGEYKKGGEIYGKGGSIDDWDDKTIDKIYGYYLDELSSHDRKIQEKNIKTIKQKREFLKKQDNKFRKQFSGGGNIPNNYEGKTAEQIWSEWDKNQRIHFISDHWPEFSDDKSREAIIRIMATYPSSELKSGVIHAINKHISEGQYGKGGSIYKKGGIPNNYEGKTGEKVWGEWTILQREHFLYDHNDQTDVHGVSAQMDMARNEYKDLTRRVKDAVVSHVAMEQYNNGGVIKKNTKAKQEKKIYKELKGDSEYSKIAKKFTPEQVYKAFQVYKSILASGVEGSILEASHEIRNALKIKIGDDIDVLDIGQLVRFFKKNYYGSLSKFEKGGIIGKVISWLNEPLFK